MSNENITPDGTRLRPLDVPIETISAQDLADFDASMSGAREQWQQSLGEQATALQTSAAQASWLEFANKVVGIGLSLYNAHAKASGVAAPNPAKARTAVIGAFTSLINGQSPQAVASTLLAGIGK